jgi:hypothetical protein
MIKYSCQFFLKCKYFYDRNQSFTGNDSSLNKLITKYMISTFNETNGAAVLSTVYISPRLFHSSLKGAAQKRNFYTTKTSSLSLIFSNTRTYFPFLLTRFTFLTGLQSTSNPLKVILCVPTRRHLVWQLSFLVVIRLSLSVVITEVSLAVVWQWTLSSNVSQFVTEGLLAVD